MRKTLLATVPLLAAGIALAIGGSRSARETPVPPFGYGMLFYAPAKEWKPASPASESAGPPPGKGDQPAAPPTEKPAAAPDEKSVAETLAGGKPFDIESRYSSFSAEGEAAVRSATAPLATGATLPIRVLIAVGYVPPESVSLPQAFAVAIVDDADADRVLAPLVAGAQAQVFAAADVPLAEVLAAPPFPKEAAGVPAARLPASARCFASLILVRRSAASRLGLAPREERGSSPDEKSPLAPLPPNVLVVSLNQPGQLEEVMRLAWPLADSHGISARPVDLAIDSASLAWWLGVAGLTLIVAGGCVLVAGVVSALGRRAEPHNSLLVHVHTGMHLVDAHAREFHLVQAALAAAIVVGAAWGGPAVLGQFLREATPEPLARIGLESTSFGAAPLFDFFIMSLMTNIILWAIIVFAVPSAVPGLGLLTALAHNVLWGAALAPATLTFLDRLPLRGAVVAVEAQGYAILVLAAWYVALGAMEPRAVGCETRRQGYAAGLNMLYRLLWPAVVVLVAAAALETALIAVVSRLG